MGIFREYVLKIALTRSIFQLRMYQIPFEYARSLVYSLQRSTIPLLLREEVWEGSGGRGRGMERDEQRAPLFMEIRPAGKQLPYNSFKVTFTNFYLGFIGQARWEKSLQRLSH